MSRPPIELSGLQVFASVMAAVTGAVLASFLGVAGTVVGTAVASFAGTAGAAVYNHYLRRTKDRLAPVIVARAQQWTPGPYGAAPDAKQADEAKAGSGEAALAGFEESAPDAGEAGETDEASEEHDAAAETAPEAEAGQGGRRRWLIYGGTAAAIFIVVMAGITVFELLTGKPLSSTVWHHSGSGTSVSSVVSGDQHSATTPQPTPAGTRQAQSTATSSPATSTTPTSAPSPSSSAASPGVSASPSASKAG